MLIQQLALCIVLFPERNAALLLGILASVAPVNCLFYFSFDVVIAFGDCSAGDVVSNETSVETR